MDTQVLVSIHTWKPHAKSTSHTNDMAIVGRTIYHESYSFHTRRKILYLFARWMFIWPPTISKNVAKWFENVSIEMELETKMPQMKNKKNFKKMPFGRGKKVQNKTHMIGSRRNEIESERWAPQQIDIQHYILTSETMKPKNFGCLKASTFWINKRNGISRGGVRRKVGSRGKGMAGSMAFSKVKSHPHRM